ncbi:hypothetical protein LBMAG42_18120 [Deltaproteobacteria bacterium]|nr:hypothetical protein LBMAG42_18120 [Deltaproteobacteria bacterium]
MDWSEVTRRVVVEAAAPHPNDVVVCFGADLGVAVALAARVERVTVRTVSRDRPGDAPANLSFSEGPVAPFALPNGTSVVVLHDALRRLDPAAQRELIRDIGRQLPPRALLVIGDVMWSMPPDRIDAPEQFGDQMEHAPTVAALERLVREAGFLPDVHRFGVGRAVCIALRGN